jgi:hypothetical protein
MALFEAAQYDPRSGAPVNDDLASDHTVTTNADAPEIDVTFLDYPDSQLNALGAPLRFRRRSITRPTFASWNSRSESSPDRVGARSRAAISVDFYAERRRRARSAPRTAKATRMPLPGSNHVTR